MEGLIAQLKVCLLDCFDWESNYCAMHWCISCRVMWHLTLQKSFL